MKTIKTDEVLIIRNEPQRKGFFYRLLDPTYILRDVYLEQSEGYFKIVLISDKYGIFGVSSTKSYVETCFPGGDPYYWMVKDEQKAIDKVLEYKQRVGQVIYI